MTFPILRGGTDTMTTAADAWAVGSYAANFQVFSLNFSDRTWARQLRPSSRMRSGTDSLGTAPPDRRNPIPLRIGGSLAFSEDCA